jgi:hypothetical protein
MLAPNEKGLTVFNGVSIPNLANNGDKWSLGASVSCLNDITPLPPVDPKTTNNMATVTIPFIVGRKGQDATYEWRQSPWTGKWILMIFALGLFTIGGLVAHRYYRRKLHSR